MTKKDTKNNVKQDKKQTHKPVFPEADACSLDMICKSMDKTRNKDKTKK
jgi:hypothetical protein